MLGIFADSFMTATRMPTPNDRRADDGYFHNEQPHRARIRRKARSKRSLLDI